MPKNLKGGGAQFKAKPAGPGMKSKKMVITLAGVQFSAQIQVKSKKKGHHALRLSFLRISPLFAFVCKGGGGPIALGTPLLRLLKNMI